MTTMDKTRHEFRLTAGLAPVWRQFIYLDYFQPEKDPIFYCEDIKQAEIFWDAFNHFFDTEVDWNPTFVNQDRMPEKVQYIPFAENRWDLYKERLRRDWSDKMHVGYSFISNKIDMKGIDTKAYQEMHLAMVDHVNLGDTRNFKTSEECIEKITAVAQSSLYLGSDCAWSNIAPIFDVPVVIVFQKYPYSADQVWSRSFFVDKKNNVPYGFKPL